MTRAIARARKMLGSQIPPCVAIERPRASWPVELHAVAAVIPRRSAPGCGNAGPVEITTRFPQDLGNLAQTARFPHFHSRSVMYFSKSQKTKAAHASRAPTGGAGQTLAQ
jgi:hypothetical protein